ncbi:DUF3866 family protein [Georgenia sp. MJ206]|uniref:DUF3866 family protein n=1 Tax=Georgenia wangjunii TaxID=3117730 RepID=UPI002F26209C
MIMWREGVVRAVGRAWTGAVEVEVELTGTPGAVAPHRAGEPGADEPGRAGEPGERAGTGRLDPGARVRALAYPALVGAPEVGDRVSLTVAALARGLGTGGYAMVAAIPDRLPADPPPGAGHIVKARYTPLQAMLLGVDEQESPWHEALREADDLAGLPVVVADLHSALPAVVAGVRAEADRTGAAPPRVAYVMTDGGALPAWFSRTVATLRADGWLAGTITVGQAFGGDLEAVTLHTGLLAAREVLDADVVVVAQGPGNLGTGTRWGFSGVACGEAVNAAAVLGGRPVASLRVSGADPRERHRGISHHSLTAYGRVALAAADVVVPAFDGASPAEADLTDLGHQVAEEAAALAEPHGRHRLVPVGTAGLLDALAAAPVRLSTMGRGLAEDPAAFLAVAAAGVHAQRLSPAGAARRR